MNIKATNISGLETSKYISLDFVAPEILTNGYIDGKPLGSVSNIKNEAIGWDISCKDIYGNALITCKSYDVNVDTSGNASINTTAHNI